MKNKMSVNPLNAVLSLLFCVALTVAFAAFIFIPDSDFSQTEKRVLSLFPELSLRTVTDGTFEAEIETYLQDQMPLRNLFVGISSYAELLLGQNGTGDVYKCEDDYLINAPVDFNEKKLNNNLKLLKRFADSAKLDSYMLIVPQTGYIMDSKLPSPHGVYADDEIFSCIKENIGDSYKLVDIRDAFKKSKDSTQLYYRTDHHWTQSGSFIAANEFLEASGKSGVSRDSYTVETHNGFCGTTHSTSAFWLTPPDIMELWRPKNAKISVTVTDLGSVEKVERNDVYFSEHLDEYDMYPVYLNGNHSLTHIVNENADGGVLLILKDSFGNSLASQLAAVYREIIMVDLRYYRTEAVSDLIEEYSIDMLLVNYGVDGIINDTNFIWLK